MFGFNPLGSAPLGGIVVEGINNTLTGVASTGTAGSLTPRVSAILSGVSGTGTPGTLSGLSVGSMFATGVAGTLTPNVRAILSGVAGTAIASSLSISRSISLSGVSATATIGTLTPNVIGILSGIFATATTGTISTKKFESAIATAVANSLTSSISLTLTGTSASGLAGTLTPSVSVTLSGSYATGQAGILVPSLDITLNSITATGVAGILVPSISVVSLTGVYGQGLVNTFDSSTSYSLSGVNSATAVAGTLIQNYLTLTSGIAIGQVGTLFDSLLIDNLGVYSTAIAANIISSVGGTPTGVYATGVANSVNLKLEITSPSAIATAAYGSLIQPHEISILLTGVYATGVATAIDFVLPDAAMGFYGTPVPGGTISLTFNEMGNPDLPETISITINIGDTLAEIAEAIAQIVNNNVIIQSSGIYAGERDQVIDFAQPDTGLIYTDVLLSGT